MPRWRGQLIYMPKSARIGSQRDDWQCSKCNSGKNRHRAGDLWYGGDSREGHAGQAANIGAEITRLVCWNNRMSKSLWCVCLAFSAKKKKKRVILKHKGNVLSVFVGKPDRLTFCLWFQRVKRKSQIRMIRMRTMMTTTKRAHRHSRARPFRPRQAMQHQWPNWGFLPWLAHMGCTLEDIRVRAGSLQGRASKTKNPQIKCQSICSFIE